MKMAFQVTYDDGRVVEAVAKPKDVVAFERQYGQSMTVFADKSTPTHMEWLFYLAWSPLHRSKQEPRAFDEFLDAVEDVDLVDEESEAAPFSPAPSDAPPPG
jgi:hypothetical protein